MQKEGKEQVGEANEEALEKAKEKKAKRRQPKRRNAAVRITQMLPKLGAR
jgi:hypothetical protein